MKMVLWNLVLAIFWMGLWNEISGTNFIVGLFIGLVVLYLGRRAIGETEYFRKIKQIVSFLFFFQLEFLYSVLRLTYDILTPTHRMSPSVLAIPLDAKTDVEIILLSNVISLTPGTLTLDISEDRKFIYVHFLYLEKDNVESTRHSIKEKFEKRILEILR